ncbi:hypothetical protein IA826_02295 [Listeria seeligeri]|uniref:hypothetical protein n=1 Tax=Listeria seeligeri TaxID=1640 RepID=UPI001625E001|nr:hypothetical protein [Listeria seeligeri]MBF2400561.1 hypothetical protein [Listeria seeligeri]MBF2499609.1 hypothetical protein [Listeria seeligeri]MBF2651823.1 hypothetical protein [Listeria seeligeri]
MAGFIKKYAEEKNLTLHRLAKQSYISESTLRTADTKTIYNLSVLNVTRISNGVGDSPGQVLDDLFKCEQEIKMENSYYYNKDTNILLTGKEYDKNIERDALERWEEIKDDYEEQEENAWHSLEEIKKSLMEEESDFVLSDKDGNPLTEW